MKLIGYLIAFVASLTVAPVYAAPVAEVDQKPYLVGADQPDAYMPHLAGKRVGLVVNQASQTSAGHTIDRLLASGVDVRLLFALEHGLRGTEDAGATVSDSTDAATGLPIRSLYGKSKQPSAEDLQKIDAIVYDIQDVGVRFFTYISSMHYLMQSCADAGVSMVVLDRPNPSGDILDGPVLDLEFRSFVGMHPIPVLYGMTPGELAQMINGEGWLDGGKSCALTVVPIAGYTHGQPVELVKRPSPNLPTMHAISLYPSLALFEATDVSIGRGTQFPFEVAGGPDKRFGTFEFTPVSTPGMALHPRHEGLALYGDDLRGTSLQGGVDLVYFMRWRARYHEVRRGFLTRPHWLDKLMGTDTVRRMIEDGKTADEIRASWAPGLAAFRKMRAKYLLY